jgi:hypothetical protein
MLPFDEKKAITSIMAKRHPKSGEQSSAPMAAELPTKDEAGEIDGRHAAAQDVLSAMHEKSPQKMAEALANFHDLHKMHSEKKPSPKE